MIAIAWLVLYSWPIVGIILYNRLRLDIAFCATIFGGYLLLPEGIGFNPPILPTFNKYTIPPLTAFVLTAVKLSQNTQSISALPGWIPRDPVTLSLLALLVLGTFGTIFTNQDPLFYGPRYLIGMRIYDGFSFSLELFMMLLPFLVARRLFATPETQRTLLLALALSALVYTIPALWEIRMSPQLHRQLYGYFSGPFLQQLRADGFRPVVFLNHGLALGIFLCFATLSAAGLYRMTTGSVQKKWGWATGWLLCILVMTKSFGALSICLLLLPVLLFLTPRLQVLIAAGVASIILTYPVLRVADLIPTQRILTIVESIDVGRAQSLSFRFENEDRLLAKSQERPIFGWGGYSRSRVFNDKGQDISVVDGAWVGELGGGGWVRYVGFFGLLCWPVIGLFMLKKGRLDPVCAILAVILCGKLIDIIPNTGLVPYVWAIAGALAGRLENKMAVSQTGHTGIQVRQERPPPTYARDFSVSKPVSETLTTEVGAPEHSYRRISKRVHVRKR